MIICVLPVVDFDASFRVGVVACCPLAKGRVVKTVCLHSVELVIDVTDQARRVLDKEKH